LIGARPVLERLDGDTEDREIVLIKLRDAVLQRFVSLGPSGASTNMPLPFVSVPIVDVLADLADAVAERDDRILQRGVRLGVEIVSISAFVLVVLYRDITWIDDAVRCVDAFTATLAVRERASLPRFGKQRRWLGFTVAACGQDASTESL
jgi:hypothetical protein